MAENPSVLEKPHSRYLLVILILTIGVYCNSLFNDFVYDDTLTVTDNQFIRDWKNLPDLLSDRYFSRSGEETFRPIVTLTYFVDYALWRLEPSGYHFTNILIHSVNAVLLYLFIFSLSSRREIAFLSALIFGVHPIQTEVVNVISYREDLLATLFLLLAFLMFFRIFNPSGISKLKKIFLYFLSLVFYLLSLLSKELAVTFPLFLVGHHLCFGHQESRKERNLFIYLLIGYSLITFAYLLLYFGSFSNPNPSTISGPELLVRLMTLPKILIYNLWIILIPWELNADYVIRFSHSWSEISVLFPMFVLIGFGVVVYKLFGKYKEEMFGLWWFFLGLLPVMNIFPIHNIIAERYLYYPFIGLCFFFSSSTINLYRRGISRYTFQLWKRAALVAVVVLILTVLMLRTSSRNMDWKNNLSLWSKTVTTSPKSHRAHYNLGNAYLRKGSSDLAIKEFKEAVRINPKNYKAYYNLGFIHYRKGLTDLAIKEFKEAIRIYPKYSNAHYDLGAVYQNTGSLHKALKEYKIVIQIDPEGADAYYNIGVIYREYGLLNQAASSFKEALRINPDLSEVKKALENLHLPNSSSKNN